MLKPDTLQTLRALPTAVLAAAAIAGCSAPEPAPATHLPSASERRPPIKLPTCTKIVAAPDKWPHSIEFRLHIDGIEDDTSPTDGYRVSGVSYDFGDDQSQDIFKDPLKQTTHSYNTAGRFSVAAFATVLIDTGTPPIKSDVVICPIATVTVS